MPADHLAFVLQQALRDRPAVVHRADEVLLRHFDVVEERLAERRRAADQTDRRRGDAGRLHIEQQEADAFVLRHVEVGAHETEDPIRFVGVRRPDLRAVHEVIVAHVFGARAQAGEIRTGARFRVTLTPADFAAHDLRQVLELLRFVTELEQCRAEHPDAEARQRRSCIDAAEFLLQHAVLVDRQSAAAVLLRPHRTRPAFLGHPRQPHARFGIDELLAAAAPNGFFFVAGGTHRRRTVRLEPGAGFAAERVEIAHGLHLGQSLGCDFSEVIVARAALRALRREWAAKAARICLLL